MEAAAEEDTEKTSEDTKEDTEAEPDMLIASDASHNPLSAGQEYVIMHPTITLKFVILRIAVGYLKDIIRI